MSVISEKLNIEKNLREIREVKKITKKDLARKSGISYCTVAEIEKGNLKKLTITKLVKLIEVLNVSLEELLVERCECNVL